MRYPYLLRLLMFVVVFGGQTAQAEQPVLLSSTLSITECGGIYLDSASYPPLCTLRQGNELGCDANQLRGSCAAELMKSCASLCDAPTDPSCAMSCETECHSNCDSGAQISCESTCQRDCASDCTAVCAESADPMQCQASCSTHCAQNCDEACIGIHYSNSCAEKCQASCEGACSARANLACQMDCQSSVFAECTLQMQTICEAKLAANQELVYCNGQYVHTGDNHDQCVAALRSRRWFDDQQPDCSTNGCSIGSEEPASLGSLAAMLILISGLLVARGKMARVNAKRVLHSASDVTDRSQKTTLQY